MRLGGLCGCAKSEAMSDGSAYGNLTALDCAVDVDCPGTMVCYANATWNQAGGAQRCLCSTWYGATGPSCKDVDTPNAQWWFATGVVFALFFVGVFLLTLRGRRARTLTRPTHSGGSRRVWCSPCSLLACSSSRYGAVVQGR